MTEKKEVSCKQQYINGKNPTIGKIFFRETYTPSPYVSCGPPLGNLDSQQTQNKSITFVQHWHIDTLYKCCTNVCCIRSYCHHLHRSTFLLTIPIGPVFQAYLGITAFLLLYGMWCQAKWQRLFQADRRLFELSPLWWTTCHPSELRPILSGVEDVSKNYYWQALILLCYHYYVK